MAFAHVQSIAPASGGVSPFAPAISATGQNNLVVVTIRGATNALTGMSVTDNASVPNTYVQANTINDGSLIIWQFYGVQVTGGATSISMSWTGGGSVRAIIEEFSGGATSNATVFDKSSTGTGAAATSGSVTSFAPTNTGELIVAGMLANAVISGQTAGTNYTLGGTNNLFFTEYNLSGSASETAPLSWTGSASYDEIAAAYNPAPALPSTSLTFATAPQITVMRQY